MDFTQWGRPNQTGRPTSPTGFGVLNCATGNHLRGCRLKPWLIVEGSITYKLGIIMDDHIFFELNSDAAVLWGKNRT